MSEPKKHHYLPVFYLSRWAGVDGKVVRYHRPQNTVVATRIAPKNTGYELGLYTLDGYPDSLRHRIETGFMAPAVDGPAAQALEVMIGDGIGQLTPELRQAWTMFLMSLHVRNPTEVEHITRVGAEVARQQLSVRPEKYDAVRGPDDPPTLPEWVDKNLPAIFDNHGKQLLPGIITHKDTGNTIIKMHWWIIETAMDFPDLLIGDRPVYMSHGVTDERCFIAVPLSPRFVFFATRAQHSFDSVMSHGIEAVTKWLNHLMVLRGDKYVYAASDRHLRFVENRLARTRHL